jgi:hypothetical protein
VSDRENITAGQVWRDATDQAGDVRRVITWLRLDHDRERTLAGFVDVIGAGNRTTLKHGELECGELRDHYELVYDATLRDPWRVAA